MGWESGNEKGGGEITRRHFAGRSRDLFIPDSIGTKTI